MKPILEIKGISKKFRIRHELLPYESLRDRIMDVFKGKKMHSQEEFWALKDVSFEVHEGESLGIIGKNGAGKSTLLKILSKITPPTSGRIVSRGRVASLLEVGTGFHPELTGRENVFLNGSILGMKKKEIQDKFDEIVDFSGVEKFLDTPLKHYSSGMQLRLAFAVAAFLEPEILVIDEVLSVGDSEFQKRCIKKMESISQKQGRTILFVSHQMSSIAKLCKKAIWLNDGQINIMADSNAVIDKYLGSQSVSDNGNIFTRKNTESIKKDMFILEAATLNSKNEVCHEFSHDEPITVRMKIKVNHFVPGVQANIVLLNKFNNRVFSSYCELDSEKYKNENIITLHSKIAADFIAPNKYSFIFALVIPKLPTLDEANGVCNISIIDKGSELYQFYGYDSGDVFGKCEWY